MIKHMVRFGVVRLVGWLHEDLARMCQHELNVVGSQSLYAFWL